jgi:hypothetical protein
MLVPTTLNGQNQNSGFIVVAFGLSLCRSQNQRIGASSIATSGGNHEVGCNARDAWRSTKGLSLSETSYGWRNDANRVLFIR